MNLNYFMIVTLFLFVFIGTDDDKRLSKHVCLIKKRWKEGNLVNYGLRCIIAPPTSGTQG